MSQTVTWLVFADYLRSIRQHQGISQRCLAEKIGCSEHHLWRLEHQQRHPSKALLRVLRHEFLLTPEDSLLFDAFETMLTYRCHAVDLEEISHRAPLIRIHLENR
jgi:transcriptional regulator with XRE-family HTH domain